MDESRTDGPKMGARPRRYLVSLVIVVGLVGLTASVQQLASGPRESPRPAAEMALTVTPVESPTLPPLLMISPRPLVWLTPVPLPTIPLLPPPPIWGFYCYPVPLPHGQSMTKCVSYGIPSSTEACASPVAGTSPAASAFPSTGASPALSPSPAACSTPGSSASPRSSGISPTVEPSPTPS